MCQVNSCFICMVGECLATKNLKPLHTSYSTKEVISMLILMIYIPLVFWVMEGRYEWHEQVSAVFFGITCMVATDGDEYNIKVE